MAGEFDVPRTPVMSSCNIMGVCNIPGSVIVTVRRRSKMSGERVRIYANLCHRIVFPSLLPGAAGCLLELHQYCHRNSAATVHIAQPRALAASSFYQMRSIHVLNIDTLKMDSKMFRQL